MPGRLKLCRPIASLRALGVALLEFGFLCWIGFAQGVSARLPGAEVLEGRLAGVPVLSLRNPQLAELTVSLDLTLENAEPSVPVPFQLTLAPGHTTPPLVSLRPRDGSRPWHYSYRLHFTWGSPAARQAADQVYRLPFAPGFSCRVVQGRDGAFSHTGEDRYAVDFGVAEGTPVLAAREGLVVLVRDGFETGSPDPSLRTRANLIFVRHSDATLGEYLHLLKGGMKVKPGDKVRLGQQLGLSGNSGYSRGPHLHFMVFRSKDSHARESLPIRFLTKEGPGIELEQGRSYTALPITGSAGSGWLK
jgi:murein DD-endopeptidase MepM/ murein hydrolase activator NlpD